MLLFTPSVPPLHLAISTAIQPGGQEFGYDCFNFLIKNNANISLRVTIPYNYIFNKFISLNYDFRIMPYL